jgi:hypothetical protein
MSCIFRALVCGFLLAHSSTLWACAVCGVGKEESRLAFIITTGILTFVPLIVIGFVIYYIYRQVKVRERATAISENFPA